MEREIFFRPAFDKRNIDPNKNYGIHSVDMVWILKGRLGAVQFVVYTGWHLPHIQRELKGHITLEPLPADIGYHSPRPMYDGQEVASDSCKYVGGPCYYDGSGLHAMKVFDILLEEGSDAVWEYLQQYYVDTFGGED